MKRQAWLQICPTGRPWTRKDEALLRKLYPKAPMEQIESTLGRSRLSIKSYAQRFGLRREFFKRKRWTPKEDRLLRKLYPTTLTSELARRFSCSELATYQRASKLGLKKTPEYVASNLQRLGRRLKESGKSHRFPKGHTPQNKGLRRPGWFAGRMRETQFKKGQRVAGQFNTGDTRLIDGYLYTKVSEIPHVAYTVNWKPTHHLLWHKAHGPIPPHHVLAFKDRDKTHVTLDNLELIHRRDLCRRNSVHTLPPDLKQIVQLTGALKRQIRRRDGEKQNVGSTGSPVRSAGAGEGPGQAART